ncbi:hypothetical protein EV644_14223 [Kribbella orskensis]|uniref:Uncharacterized protein n=1 Tax=Kribbella orskensis TaxID=2512216 RepID=A0ABY2B700_9ACTN|nr:hypothetical protein EV642_14523 [Kribbella sp. VKM Ac-2500]TCO08991.1 hypothetical protein EV644_14223 [Kribbella orskensis]
MFGGSGCRDVSGWRPHPTPSAAMVTIPVTIPATIRRYRPVMSAASSGR